jgi:hypothetical protein
VAAQALRERARAAAVPYETAAGGLDFPGVTLIAAVRRAQREAAAPPRAAARA